MWRSSSSRFSRPIWGSSSAALVFGLVVGVFGHIIHSRTLILTGILVIGLTSAYFSFVLQPSGS